MTTEAEKRRALQAALEFLDDLDLSDIPDDWDESRRTGYFLLAAQIRRALGVRQ